MGLAARMRMTLRCALVAVASLSEGEVRSERVTSDSGAPAVGVEP